MTSLDEIIEAHRIVLCCGSGGVGKTTSAAAVAIHGAQRGRKAVVVTIDPARRLADALGLAGLTNEPQKIEGPWDGELWALMLDTKSTFDALIATHATDDEQRQRILDNRFYRNISGALSGTQEYMAMEMLFDLHENTDVDLIIVDTPPSRNALDFLDAPLRLTRFLEHRLYRIVTAPTRGIVRAAGFAAQAFFRTVSKVVGGEVIGDAIAFFQAFDGMEEGFRERAHKVYELLGSATTAFLIVTSARADAIDEAVFFAEKLRESDMVLTAVIANRLHPYAGTTDIAGLRARAEELGEAPLGQLYRAFADGERLASTERTLLNPMRTVVAPVPVFEVDQLPFDVHDIPTLDAFGTILFGEQALLGDQA